MPVAPQAYSQKKTMTKKSPSQMNKLQRENEMGQTRSPEGKWDGNEIKLNLPSADQHEVSFSVKAIRRDFITKHCLDNSFLSRLLSIFLPIQANKSNLCLVLVMMFALIQRVKRGFLIPSLWLQRNCLAETYFDPENRDNPIDEMYLYLDCTALPLITEISAKCFMEGITLGSVCPLLL